MENFSEKKKRGRPKSSRRAFLERRGAFSQNFTPPTRTEINDTYVRDIDSAVRAVGACVDVWGEGRGFPKGYKTAALEAGRWAESMGDYKEDFEEAAKLIAGDRNNGVPFGVIAERFKRLRLGEKEGSFRQLYDKLHATIDDYWKTFPKTTNEETERVIRALLEDFTEQPTR